MKLKVEKIIYPGNGLVKTRNKTIIIEDGVVPGDIIEAKIISEKSDFKKAVVGRFIQFSPYREKYICKYGGKCGGCLWMGVNYQAQLQLKKEMLQDIFRRNAGINVDEIGIVESEQPFPYRLRARFKLENGRLGFYRRRSHNLIEVSECPICFEGVNRGISYFKKKYRQYRNNFPQKMEIEIRYSPFDKTTRFKPVGRYDNKLKNIFLHDINKGENYQNFEFGGNIYNLSLDTFVQINPEQNEKVIAKIKETIFKMRPDTVLDLYGGFGNLSLPSVDALKRLLIVEENRTAVEDGRHFVEMQGLSNKVEFVNAKVEDRIKELPPADLVILDPPRRGAREVFRNIDRLSPSVIVYLSCNPATLTRDIREAMENGYRIRDITIFDFFPYTPEIETMVILER